MPKKRKKQKKSAVFNKRTLSNKIITGIVDLTSKGYAYIKSDEIQEDVFVSQKNLNHALNGDKVKVYLHPKTKKNHLEGEVTEIIVPAKKTFVGIIKTSGSFALLIPDNRRMPYDIIIPLNMLNNANDGQKAIVRIINWQRNSNNPVGEVVEVLGYPGDADVEIYSILAEFELPHKFPKIIVQAAEKIPAEITEKEITKRKDFRKTLTFTIDPEDAKDFDDALSIRKLENGNTEVGIHIADVTHYVIPGTSIDKEAFKRGTSVYLVDRVIPMLPERLSNFICSLRPDEDKLCYSAVFELDDNANIHNEWFGRTIIRSNKRFAYQEVQKIIEAKQGDFSKEILILNKFAQKLKKKRFENGSLAFEKAEVKFTLDEKGFPVNVYFQEHKEAHKLIEEFMLLANKKVAEIIGKPKVHKKAKTFVYRIHDKPDIDKLNSLSHLIKRFGYRIKTTSDKEITLSINKLLNDISGKKEQNIIETLTIRVMAKAVYSTNNIGHYGLAFSHYTHFTSPIRRYPDMMTHRLLDLYLNGEKSVNSIKYEIMCRHSSEMEQKAVDAERASVKYKQVEFMSDKIGEQFDGIISGVTKWGLYVEIVENKCEGMLPLRELIDDFYIFDENNYCLIGNRKKKKYQLGDNIKIEVLSADVLKRQLDFGFKV